jgi:inositol transport system permease protein
MSKDKDGARFVANIREMGFAGLYNRYGTILIFVAILIIASISSPFFLTSANLTNVLKQLVVVTLLAFGATFIIILAQIDVSYGSVVALTGCIAADVMSKTQSIALALLSGIALGVFIGLINGFVITTYKIPAFIETLAMTAIARGVVLLYTRGVPVANLGNFNFIGQGSIGFVPFSVIIFLIFLLISWVLLNRTKFGRHVYAAGGNATAAIASGINVNKVIRLAFIYNGVLASAAGIVLMSRINSGQPAAGVGYEFSAITSVVVGGTSLMGGIGNIAGTFVGALIIGVIDNVLDLLNVNSSWQQIVRGIIIALAVILDVKTKVVRVRKKA